MTGFYLKTFAQNLRSLLPMSGNALEKEPPRYEACSILSSAAVPYCIWCEDALAAHGVPTIVFDLFLLTPDPEKAAAALIEAGYVRKEPNVRFSDITQFSNRLGPDTLCEGDKLFLGELRPPEPSSPSLTAVVLLSAKEWSYDFPEAAEDVDPWLPPLGKLLDSLMAKWHDLDDSDCSLRSRIAVFICYIYYYVLDVREPEFEKAILKEHWQLHFDLVAEAAGSELNSSPCQHYYRRIRDKIRTGEHEPQIPQPGDVRSFAEVQE